MESILRDAIVSHLIRCKLIFDSQRGSTKRRSCLTNLLEYLEEVTKFLDSDKSVEEIVYLDFAKAFDKVPIRKLQLQEGLGNLMEWSSE